MSTLQGTFSLMRISDQDALKLLSFSVPSVISIHFLRISWVYLDMSTYSKSDPPVARHGIPLKRYLTWNPDVFQAKACKKTIPTVSFIPK